MHCGRAKTVEDGTVRQWSNQRLHEHWRIPPVSVEVAEKRIGRLKAMLRDEANHTLALAAICGRFLGRDVLEEKGGLCEGANPFAVAFHRDVYLFEGVTGTEELCEALRKVGFQSLFVSQSEAWEALQRIDTSLLRAACWTMASGMRLERHVKAQCGETSKFDWCCEILSEYGVPCGSRFRSKKSLEMSSVAEQITWTWSSDVSFCECHHQLLSMVSFNVRVYTDCSETCCCDVVWSLQGGRGCISLANLSFSVSAVPIV